jgi:CheY-like chemotaxis protein
MTDPIPESSNKPLSLVLVCSDFMFISTIEGTAKELGIETRLAMNAEGTVAALADPAALVIVDLELPELDCSALMQALPSERPRVVGFYPHVLKDRFDAATAAGFDEVLTRGRFTSDLATILRSLG